MTTRGSVAWMQKYWGNPCHPDLVPFTFWSGWTVKVQRQLVDSGAVAALDAWFAHHSYAPHPGAGAGCYACRDQKGHPGVKSTHSWATSIDENPAENPYRTDRLVTNMPLDMIYDGILRVRTNNGAPVWMWGGDWDGRPDTRNSNYDSMHFQCVATPAELATGIDPATLPQRAAPSAAPTALEEFDMDKFFIIRYGDAPGAADDNAGRFAWFPAINRKTFISADAIAGFTASHSYCGELLLQQHAVEGIKDLET